MLTDSEVIAKLVELQKKKDNDRKWYLILLVEKREIEQETEQEDIQIYRWKYFLSSNQDMTEEIYNRATIVGQDNANNELLAVCGKAHFLLDWKYILELGIEGSQQIKKLLRCKYNSLMFGQEDVAREHVQGFPWKKVAVGTAATVVTCGVGFLLYENGDLIIKGANDVRKAIILHIKKLLPFAVTNPGTTAVIGVSIIVVGGICYYYLSRQPAEALAVEDNSMSSPFSNNGRLPGGDPGYSYVPASINDDDDGTDCSSVCSTATLNVVQVNEINNISEDVPHGTQENVADFADIVHHYQLEVPPPTLCDATRNFQDLIHCQFVVEGDEAGSGQDGGQAGPAEVPPFEDSQAQFSPSEDADDEETMFEVVSDEDGILILESQENVDDNQLDENQN